MHSRKGNTHFIYLEETKDGNYQPERRGGNKAQDKRTDKRRVCIWIVLIRYEPGVYFSFSGFYVYLGYFSGYF